MTALRRSPNRLRTVLPFLGCATLASACVVVPSITAGPSAPDPTIRLATDATGELGVSTPYGVVFLGRGAHSGEVEFAAWFQDGPSYESGIIEPLGGGLFVTEAEIVLPTVDLSHATPKPGSQVLVRGRERAGAFQIDAVVASDERVDGLVLTSNEALRALPPGQIGAGVYVEEGGELRLVGLLSGRLQLEFGGETRDVFTVVGPNELWRLVAHRRNLDQPRRLPRRGDVVPR